MAKILSRSGDSLADTYDVEGSIVGVEDLNAREVHLTHEMGGVIFSERLTGSIVATAAAATAQNLAFAAAGPDMAQTSKLLALQVTSSETTGRLDDVVVLLGGPGDTEIPIWNWLQADGAINTLITIGGSLADINVLQPHQGLQTIPLIIPGTDQPVNGVGPNRLILRGNTSGFGAGTVVVQMLAYFAFAIDPGMGGSRGLPVPSW